ncbi:MAG: hypothetical protein HZA78_08695 [Candidatus Schekmanbacteria bacterium]|nr:hypothetical protein [Candidatus Schekmanbacteria bacterium]
MRGKLSVALEAVLITAILSSQYGCKNPLPVLVPIENLFEEIGVQPKGLWLSAVGRNNDVTELLVDRARFKKKKTAMIGNLHVSFNGYGKKALCGWSDQNYLRDENFSMGSGSVSVGCKIFLKSPQPDMSTIIDYKHSGNSGLFLNIINGAKVKLHVGNGEYSRTVESKDQLTLNTWHMLVGVNDGTNLYLFIDGKLTDMAMDANVLVSKEKGITIGQWCGGSGRALREDSLLMDVFIMDQALTAAQIYFLYSGGGGYPI